MSETAENTANSAEPTGTPTPPKGGKRWKAGLGLAVAAACLAAIFWGVSSRGAASTVGEPGEEPVLDTVPPQLLGVQDMTVALGGMVSYRDGVTAVDDVDGPLSFQVDAEAVDLSAAGTYPVTYSARDAAGNEVQETITVTVIETITVDQDMELPEDEEEPDSSGGAATAVSIALENITREDVDRLADQILAKITTPGMSQREKAKAIYDYVNQHVKYVGTSDKSSWIIGAYVGFTYGRGDCFNYYACSKALLTQAGISNVDLRRVGSTSSHYWQLVNTGDGWYHFDTCPHPNGYPLYAFMLTEPQVRAYTELASPIRQNYYVYDYAACPVRAVGMPEEEPPVPVEDETSGETDSEAEDGTQPPEGEVPEDGTQPPEGEVPEDGTQPPEGEIPEDGTQPPEGEIPEDGTQPPEGEVPEDGTQPPEEKLPEDGTQPAPEGPDSSAQTAEGVPPESSVPVPAGMESGL